MFQSVTKRFNVLLLLILTIIPLHLFAASGDLIEIVKITAVTRDAVVSARSKIPQTVTLPPIRNGLVFYRVVYETPDLKKSPSRASGLMIVPDSGSGPYPLLSYQHGTLPAPTAAPSMDLENGGGLDIGVLYGSLGYVVALPDYLGLGISPGGNPYCNAKTEASTAADLLRAARQAQSRLGFKLNSHLFLAGYSEGGQATMALHRHLERDLAGEFKVTASAPMSGPYDLSRTSVREALTQPGPHASAEAAYLIDGMNLAYGLFKTYDGVIAPSYQAVFVNLLDGKHTMGQILNGLPPKPTQYMDPDFVTDLLGHPRPGSAGAAFIRALQKNDVFDWKPMAPVRLYYGGADRDVPFDNAKVAYARMKSLGAHVELVDVGDTLDHRTAALPSLEGAAVWFETFR